MQNSRHRVKCGDASPRVYRSTPARRVHRACRMQLYRRHSEDTRDVISDVLGVRVNTMSLRHCQLEVGADLAHSVECGHWSTIGDITPPAVPATHAEQSWALSAAYSWSCVNVTETMTDNQHRRTTEMNRHAQPRCHTLHAVAMQLTYSLPHDAHFVTVCTEQSLVGGTV